MNKQKILKKAVLETYKKYRTKGLSHQNAIEYIVEAFDNATRGEFCGFTRDNNARAGVEQIGQNELVKTMCKAYVDDYLFEKDIEDEFTWLKVTRTLSDNYRDHMWEINDNLRTRPREVYERFINLVINEHIVIEEVPKDIVELAQVYPQNIALVSGKMVTKSRTDISLGGNMHAASDIGKIPKTQQDAFLMMKHIDNPDFKFMVVADGMGRSIEGKTASDMAVKLAGEWFDNLDSEKYYKNVDKLIESGQIANLTKKIDKEISEKLQGRGATTFLCAIVGENETIISNVGDSRAYAVNKNEVEQVTNDHSVAYEMWKSGKIPYREDIRLYEEAEQLTRYLGNGEFKPTDVEHTKLDNDSYGTLLLVTDGVTDCLTDEKLKVISKKTTSRKDLAASIVDASKAKDLYVATEEQISEVYNNGAARSRVQAGHDNATAIVYDSKATKRRGIFDRGGR